MKLYKKYILFSTVLLTSVMISGCWDYQEIQKRGYVLGIAIDKATEAEMINSEVERIPLQLGPPKYAFAIQIPIIPRAQFKPAGQGGGGGGEQKRVWNLRILGNSFFNVVREYLTRLDYPGYYEHLQSIIISEDAARMGIIEPLDLMLRDSEMRRTIKVYVTPESAYKVLEVSPNIDDYSAFYAKNLTTNGRRNSRILVKTDLGELSKALHVGKDFAIPRIIATKTEIKNVGGSIFKGDKFVGSIDETKAQYLRWVANTAKADVVIINTPNVLGYPVALDVKKVKTSVKPKVNGESITMVISTKAKADMAERVSVKIANTFDDKTIHEFEKDAALQIKKHMEDTVSYLQSEYGADVMFFDVVTKRYAPKTWDKVKDKWHEVFPNIAVEINVNIEIQDIGLVK